MSILREVIDTKSKQTYINGPLIEVRNLGVKYVLGNKREDIQSLTYNLFRKRSMQEFWALKDVNFVCRSGDILGIIGSNGAGKTTLCRVVSGLLRPDKGEIKVEGQVSALLSLGTGFNQELSGEENIFLNGTMLGLSRKEVECMIPGIVEFSGLRHFLNEPLKHYSSGMKSRLGFSIAAMIEPEIMVLDETLSVGDLEFTEKAAQKMEEIVKKAKIIMVVTHQVDFVQKFCTKALWIEKGSVRASGCPEDVVSLYKASITGGPQTTRVVNFIETKPQSGVSQVAGAEQLGVKFNLVGKRQADDNKTGIIHRVWGKKREPFWALKDISFAVQEGEIVGIIGPNGAGKTTLCRVLSGILKADRGKAFINGDITALLTFGTGFNMQLSGRDNIYLNGMMLGIPKKKLAGLYADIVEFSGLEKFIDQPMKHYSSGMRSRLGFSIAAMIKPDVFIIDEALSVGDASFYEKASVKIQELISMAKAVIIVTHNLNFVQKVCTRALWIGDGVIKFDGSPKEAVVYYRQSLKH